MPVIPFTGMGTAAELDEQSSFHAVEGSVS